MRIIAVANKKGGAGKTTTSVSVAAGLAEMGRKVLLIDLDSQCDATNWVDPQGFSAEAGGRNVFHLFSERKTELEEVIYETNTENLFVVPASDWLEGIDVHLAKQPGAEQILRIKCGSLAPGRFDYVIIDCPPNMLVMTVNALTAANELLIPCELSSLNLRGLAALLGYVETVQERLNPHLRVNGILGCRYDVRTNKSKNVLKRLRDKFPDMMFKTFIHEDTKLGEAPDFGPIFGYEPKTRAAEDYRLLIGEIVEQERHYSEVANG